MIKAAKPVVLITGVSSGIGLETAKLFAAKGWIVVGTVRSRAQTAALRALQLDLQLADMVKPRDLERVVQTAWRTYGRIDALVCNAGYGVIGPIDTLEYAQMNEQLTVNSLAPAALVRLTVPLMRRQGYGVLVGVSSVVGRVGFSGYGIYAASKFALEGLFESLHMELAAAGIRTKLVEPSGVNTAFWDGLSQDGSNRTLTAETVAGVIFRAAIDKHSKLRYPVGQTKWLVLLRRIMPERWFLRILRRVITGS